LITLDFEGISALWSAPVGPK